MPLHIAARQGHEAVVKRLLAAPNVDVNKAIEKTRGYTPLHLAAAGVNNLVQFKIHIFI